MKQLENKLKELRPISPDCKLRQKCFAAIESQKQTFSLKETYKIMVENSDLTRINVEMCYPYCAQFKRAPGTGGVSEVGQGAFKVEQHLYDYDTVKPSQYYYPHEVSDQLLQELIIKQIDGVKTSVNYLKKLVAEIY